MEKIFTVIGTLLLILTGCSIWNSASCTYTATRFDTSEAMFKYFANQPQEKGSNKDLSSHLF